MTDSWLPDPRMVPPWSPPPSEYGPSKSEPEVASEPEPDDDLLIRPFFVTGGRTRPLRDGLRVETIVTAAPAALFAPLRFEHRQVVELCQRPLSVAEIAVGLRMPLGVARVLVADLACEGYVSFGPSTELPIEVLERIRDRVRAL